MTFEEAVQKIEAITQSTMPVPGTAITYMTEDASLRFILDFRDPDDEVPYRHVKWVTSANIRGLNYNLWPNGAGLGRLLDLQSQVLALSVAAHKALPVTRPVWPMAAVQAYLQERRQS